MRPFVMNEYVIAIDWMPKLHEIWGKLLEGGWVAFVGYVVAAFIIARIVKRLFARYMRSKRLLHPSVRFLAKLTTSLIWVLALVQALRAVGVDLVSILGAAGVAGIAIGFASQTALSNLISGFFLISESSFKIGDYVRVDSLEGTVESINLLSIYLRQPDHSLIRIPCEMLIKNPVVNITSDEIRRCDFDLGVDYSSDLAHVRRVIEQVIAEQQGFFTDDKHPATILFTGFGDSSLNLHVGAWCRTQDYHSVRYSFATALLAAFSAAKISIPFPIRDLRMSTKEQ